MKKQNKSFKIILALCCFLAFSVSALASNNIPGVGVVIKRNNCKPNACTSRCNHGGASKVGVTNEKGQVQITIKEAGDYTLLFGMPTTRTSKAMVAGGPVGGIIIKGGKNPGGSLIIIGTTNDKGEVEWKGVVPGSYTILAESNGENCPKGFKLKDGVCVPITTLTQTDKTEGGPHAPYVAVGGKGGIKKFSVVSEEKTVVKEAVSTTVNKGSGGGKQQGFKNEEISTSNVTGKLERNNVHGSITYVAAQMIALPNGMGIATQPTEAITVKEGKKTIHYTDIPSQEVSTITQQPITFLLPSSLIIVTNDIKSIGGESEQALDWYWKVYKGDNNKVIAVPMSLFLSPKGLDGLGAAMKKKDDGAKSAAPCKFQYRNLQVEVSHLAELEDDDLNIVLKPSCSGGNLVHAPQPDITRGLYNTDFPINIVYAATGTETRIVTKQASKPIAIADAKLCAQYITGYGLVVFPKDFEISCDDAGLMFNGMFQASNKIEGTSVAKKKHDYVGDVTLFIKK